ncbi:hypothetical protein TUBRATIS_20810 [Tubulinosema ratisbonensis]|uniref:Uncharacterized protein n=1 Tax=Tubulinosema ratisbonensis TaxID=291195 RepID=A0A437AK00_9MICR|nr:hypothetical protein TUBRATIS_20810 [Tubulinosema ratisbonensis]
MRLIFCIDESKVQKLPKYPKNNTPIIKQLASRIKSNGKFNSAFEILLFYMKFLGRNIRLQTKFFLKNTVCVDLRMNEICDQFLKNILKNSIQKQMLLSMIPVLFFKEIKYDEEIENIMKTKFAVSLNTNFLEFNSYIHWHIKMHKTVNILKLANYMRHSHNAKVNPFKKLGKYTNEDYRLMLEKNVFKLLARFCPPINEAYSRIKLKSTPPCKIKKQHFTFTFMVLSFKSTTTILFDKTEEIFVRKYIPLYKKIVLQNLLLELHTTLYLVMLACNYSRNFCKYFLAKTYFLFCDVQRLHCNISYQKFDMEFYKNVQDSTIMTFSARHSAKKIITSYSRYCFLLRIYESSFPRK